MAQQCSNQGIAPRADAAAAAAAALPPRHGDAARSWRAAVCELPQSRSVLLQPLLGTSPSSVGPPSPEARPRHVDMQTLAACSRIDLGRPLVGARRPPQPGHGGQSGFSWPCTASRRVRRAGCNLHVAAQAARGAAPPVKPPAAAATAAAAGLAVTSSWPCKGGSLVSCLLWMDGREVPGCTKVALSIALPPLCFATGRSMRPPPFDFWPLPRPCCAGAGVARPGRQRPAPAAHRAGWQGCAAGLDSGAALVGSADDLCPAHVCCCSSVLLPFVGFGMRCPEPD